MTALGEAALGQLLVRVTDYRTLLRLSEEQPRGDRGRHLRDAAVVRHGNALTDLVAVLESFTVARLLNLRPAVSHYQVMKWTDRIKIWRNQGGVDLTTSPACRPFTASSRSGTPWSTALVGSPSVNLTQSTGTKCWRRSLRPECGSTATGY
ncbi:hypothetical protein [Actinoplanes sp. NPDC051859]|uniref:hypothetical protein n=1 Tax=Actinoplanes sp. NPDC051859 TaxID=3363909 RepID=UPI00379C1663